MSLHNLLNPTYKDQGINKKVKMYKKTKKKRIKNKLFKDILLRATKEKGVVEYKGVVIMNIVLWDEINDEIENKEKRIAELSKRLTENE